MQVKYLLIASVALFIFGVLTGSSYGEIDPEAVVGLWLFDKGGGDKVIDSSGNGHTGAATGGKLKWVEGKFGKALEFSGDGTRVHIPHSDSLNLETFTFMMWVKLETTGGFQVVFEKQQTVGQAGHVTRNYGLEITPNNAARIWFACDGEIGPGQVDGRTVTDLEWHHVVAAYNLEEFRIYVDGQSDGVKPISRKPENNTGPISIGARMNGNCPVKGFIDEVALFSVALAERDIQLLMEEGLAQMAKGASISSLDRLPATWGKLKAE